MKNIFTTIIVICIAIITYGQVPKKFSYQAVIVDSTGELVANQDIMIKVNILRGDITSAISVYMKIFEATTTETGLMVIEVDSLDGIDWGTGETYSLKTEIDFLSDTEGYFLFSIEELQSVPFALYSGHAQTCVVADSVRGGGALPAGSEGDLLYFHNNQWTLLQPGANGQILTLQNGVPAWVGGVPVLFTDSVINIAGHNASCAVTIENNGSSEIIRSGICWSTSSSPDIGDTHTTDGNTLGSFISSLSDLALSTTYYVRAYATNSFGTAYGSTISFTTMAWQPCLTARTVTDYENNLYNTVQIGTQCWMKENLKVKYYANGTAIAYGTATSTTVGYFYYPNNDQNNVALFGLLYNWKAVMSTSSSSSSVPSGVQGICPTGWHVPSDDEWTILSNYVNNVSEYLCNGTDTYTAKSFAADTTWSTSAITCAVGNIQADNNATGFSILPAGRARSQSSFEYFNQYAYLWSATEGSSSYTKCWGIYYATATVSRIGNTTGNYKYNGYSVRCVKD